MTRWIRRKACTHCGGSGRISAIIDCPSGQRIGGVNVLCPVCLGDGKLRAVPGLKE